MEFIFRRYFNFLLNLFMYSFVSSFIFGIFAMLVWFIFRFVGSGNSFLQFWSNQLSDVGLAGSVVGFCIGSLLTVIKKIKCVMVQCYKNHDQNHGSGGIS